jgi:serine/threonine-protein kinase
MEYLGSGARSTIWRVRERKTSRYYALKRVYKQGEDDNRYLDQAINEFKVASKFDHPVIRKYYKLQRIRRWLQLQELHLYMELCEGNNCQSRRSSDILENVRIFKAVGEALAYMHSRGYVHADMKPNNIIVSSDGTVKIIDFGQSCPIGTVKERIQGTPDFIAPEQVLLKPLDGRTDVFNLGASLYWTLTGQAIPTILPKVVQGMQLIGNLDVKLPEQLNPLVPQSLSRLVMDCVELQPVRRPDIMKDVVARLDLIAHTLSHPQPQ